MLTAILVIAAAWLALIVLILAFFHGASKLRRQERRGRVQYSNLPRSWPARQHRRRRPHPRPLDTEATVTYISGQRKEGNQ